MDVKLLTFKGKKGEKIHRFQYTAIDDTTRIRALKIYERHTPANAIDFVDYLIEKFPFRIKEIRTDNGHEFQAKFHWHVEDKGIRHAYINLRCHNRTVRLSALIVQMSKNSINCSATKMMSTWKQNLKSGCDFTTSIDSGVFSGKTPYEALREKLK